MTDKLKLIWLKDRYYKNETRLRIYIFVLVHCLIFTFLLYKFGNFNSIEEKLRICRFLIGLSFIPICNTVYFIFGVIISGILILIKLFTVFIPWIGSLFI